MSSPKSCSGCGIAGRTTRSSPTRSTGFTSTATKLHFLNHKGQHFSVRGPLTVHRSPQGHPVIVQAGQSEDGRELAAETAEVIFTVQQDLEAGRAFYADVKTARRGVWALARLDQDHARRDDRDRPHPRGGARTKYGRLQALIAPEIGVKQLSAYFGMDLSKFPLDGPVPEPANTNQEVGRVKVMVELARRENLSIRQLYQRVIGQRAHRVVIGTPADIADGLEQWFTAGAADGFNILPLTFPGGLRDFVDLVVPELQRRGLFRTDYEGRTLRENLGLPRPVNRWSNAAAAELRRVS